MLRVYVILMVFLLSVGFSFVACGDKKEEAPPKTQESAQTTQTQVQPQEEKEAPGSPAVGEAALPPVLAAFSQEIVLIGEAPQKAAPDANLSFLVRVTNTSGETWFAKGSETDVTNRVRLGCFWLSSDGKEMIQTGHALLPGDLKPGEAVELGFEIKTPEKAGEYTLNITMVQEAVAWFSAKGADALKIPVMIE